MQGSLAFVAASMLVVWPMLLLLGPPLGAGRLAAVALLSAVAGSIAELLSRRIDDNLTIPLASGAAAWAALSFLI